MATKRVYTKRPKTPKTATPVPYALSPKAEERAAKAEFRAAEAAGALTAEQEYALRGWSRYTGGDLEFPMDQAKAFLHSAVDEIGALAEMARDTISANARPSSEDVQRMAAAFSACAETLCSLSVRMTRAAGKLEAYTACLDGIDRCDGMAEKMREGSLPLPWANATKEGAA